MSIYDTRRSNLTRLTANLGAKQALAMKLDMTPPQVSHWLREPHRTGARKISEDSAREIERARSGYRRATSTTTRTPRAPTRRTSTRS